MQWFTEALVSENRTRERLAVILRGAFSTSPTPLKNIPKKTGGQIGRFGMKKCLVGTLAFGFAVLPPLEAAANQYCDVRINICEPAVVPPDDGPHRSPRAPQPNQQLSSISISSSTSEAKANFIGSGAPLSITLS
jgi:hypothetical protein